MLSMLGYQRQSESVLAEMLKEDPSLNRINIDGSEVAVRLPLLWNVGSETSFLPSFSFTEE